MKGWTRIWMDTEFNGTGGGLISMALVDEYDNEFYEVVDCPGIWNTWVLLNVAPVLDKKPLTRNQFSDRLYKYLDKYIGFTLMADWPADIAHFCNALIVDHGVRIQTPKFDMEIFPLLNADASKIPHNALEDARAIRKMHVGY